MPFFAVSLLTNSEFSKSIKDTIARLQLTLLHVDCERELTDNAKLLEIDKKIIENGLTSLNWKYIRICW